MIDIKQFQRETHLITKLLGYQDLSKKATIKKLKEEIQEFKAARPADIARIKKASNIQDNEEFKAYFDEHLKDTEADEIPDLIFIMLSFCQEYHYDVELLMAVKNRYNTERA